MSTFRHRRCYKQNISYFRDNKEIVRFVWNNLRKASSTNICYTIKYMRMKPLINYRYVSSGCFLTKNFRSISFKNFRLNRSGLKKWGNSGFLPGFRTASW